MAEFFSSYSSFMNRPFQETDLPGIQVVPQFHSKILAFTVGFSLLFKVVPTIIESTWPKWYRELDPVKRKELPTYLISLVHHFVVVPFGWWHIYQDYLIWQSDVQPFENYNALNQTPLIALGCGFLLADIINCSLPDALEGKPLYMIHHSLTVILGVSAVSLIPGSFLRLNSHFLICETTNIFFNIAWVLRAAGYKGNAIVLTFEYLFALSFFPIRILNLTTAIWVLQEKGTSLGFTKYTLHPLGAMQYFWLYKILSMLHTRYGGDKSEAQDVKFTVNKKLD